MPEGRDKILRDDLSRNSYSKKQVFLTITLWLLFGVVLWAFLMSNAVSLYIFVVLCFLIRKLAMYWGEKFNAIMFPPSFVNWLQKTKFYQILAMAMKQQWSAIWILSSIIPIILLNSFLDLYFEPILELDQMSNFQGYIERIERGKSGRRSSRRDYLYIINKKGKIIKLWSIFTEKQIKELQKNKDNKGQVTIWYQKNGSLFKNTIWQIQDNEKIIQQYNKKLVIDRRDLNITFIKMISIYLIITICYIFVYYHRKLKLLR